jgi:hypothetical protein
MMPFVAPLMMASSDSVKDGLQGSVNAGIVAAVMFTVSGGTPTIVGQKNVTSITRLGTGIYRVTFASALANANYGLIASGRFPSSQPTERL